MENSLINLIQVVLAGGLAYFSVRYWKKSLNNKFKLDTNQAAYTLFIITQIVACLLIVFFAVDDQILAKLQAFKLFGEGASGLWSFIGVQTIGSVLTYFLMNVLAHLFFNSIHTTENGLHAELESNKWFSIAIYSSAFIGFVIITTSFVLRSALYVWVSKDAGLLPQLY